MMETTTATVGLVCGIRLRREVEYRYVGITRLRREGDRLLNLADGGLGPTGVVWSDEQREAARVRSAGRKGLSRPGGKNPPYGAKHRRRGAGSGRKIVKECIRVRATRISASSAPSIPGLGIRSAKKLAKHFRKPREVPETRTPGRRQVRKPVRKCQRSGKASPGRPTSAVHTPDITPIKASRKPTANTASRTQPKPVSLQKASRSHDRKSKASHPC